MSFRTERFTTIFEFYTTKQSHFYRNVSFLAFYTLNLNSTNLDGNIYVNCALAAVVDMASYLVMAFMLSKLGRRGSTVLCHLFSGILCLVTPFVREGKSDLLHF